MQDVLWAQLQQLCSQLVVVAEKLGGFVPLRPVGTVRDPPYDLRLLHGIATGSEGQARSATFPAIWETQLLQTDCLRWHGSRGDGHDAKVTCVGWWAIGEPI